MRQNWFVCVARLWFKLLHKMHFNLTVRNQTWPWKSSQRWSPEQEVAQISLFDQLKRSECGRGDSPPTDWQDDGLQQPAAPITHCTSICRTEEHSGFTPPTWQRCIGFLSRWDSCSCFSKQQENAFVTLMMCWRSPAEFHPTAQLRLLIFFLSSSEIKPA